MVSMEGKLVVVDIASHNRSRADIPLEAEPKSGGGFGCAAPATAIAVYGTPAVSGNVVYIGGYDGKIRAIGLGSDNASSWVYPPERNLSPIVGGLVLSQGKLYFGDADGKVYALDTVTQQIVWEFPTGDKIWSTPTIDGDTLYIGSFDKSLYAIDLKSGTKKWSYKTEGVIITPPLVANNAVYFGSFDRHVYSLGLDGTLAWRSDATVDNWFWARPVISGRAVYAPNLDGKVYVFNEGNGTAVNKFDLGSPVSSSPVVVGDSVIVVTQEGKVYSVTANNEPRLLTSIEQTSAPLYANSGVVFVHTLGKETLYALDGQTGVRQWSLLLGTK